MVTLTELTTISDVEYLFEFIEEQTDTKLYRVLADISTNKNRYNEFTVNSGAFLFPIDGFYTYNVYEQNSGSGNLNPSGLNRVETGRAHVFIVDAANSEYTTTESNKVYDEE